MNKSINVGDHPNGQGNANISSSKPYNPYAPKEGISYLGTLLIVSYTLLVVLAFAEGIPIAHSILNYLYLSLIFMYGLSRVK